MCRQSASSANAKLLRLHPNLKGLREYPLDMHKKYAQNSVHHHAPSIAKAFTTRFTRSLARSPFSSYRQLAKASDCSPSLLQSIARGDYLTSSKGPGIFGTYRAAAAMGVTLDDLVPPAARPTAARFLATYRGKGTPILDFSPMLPFCDVYDEPRNNNTRLVRVGVNSLLAERSGMTDPQLLQLQYERWTKAKKRRIFERQRRAWDYGVLSELELFEDKFVHTSTEVRVSFILSACRVVDLDGEKRMLIFCEPTSQDH